MRYVFESHSPTDADCRSSGADVPWLTGEESSGDESLLSVRSCPHVEGKLMPNKAGLLLGSLDEVGKYGVCGPLSLNVGTISVVGDMQLEDRRSMAGWSAV